MASPAQLTTHQHAALQAVQAFVEGPEDCFLLQGGAGTGKTTLLAALAGWLKSEYRPHTFLAPTGRAARILGDKTGADATTIHGCHLRLRAAHRLRGGGDQERPRFAVPLLSEEG